MGIQLGSNFTLNTTLPLDDRFVFADTAARDALASGRRFEGLLVYVVADEKYYFLKGGITDGDWTELSGGSGAGILTVADTTARDAIDSGERYEGLIVYVIDIETNYQLRGGITNSDWVDINSSPVPDPEITTLDSLASSDDITISDDNRDQTFLVEGASGPVTLDTVPFNVGSGILDKTTVTLIGTDDEKPVSIPYNDASGGCIGNFETLTVYRGQAIVFNYYDDLSRWIYVP